MTKNLSRQLCELCGIKQTVDFTKPENFVRLFNLKWYLPDEEYGTQEASLSFYVLFNLSNSSQDWNTEGFIKLLIKALKQHISYVESIKQSIREAEWVYD